MLRKYFMSGLMAVVALGVVLVGYNAFIADSDDGHTASNHVAEYLALDVDQASVPADETTVATDSTTTTTTEPEQTSTETTQPSEGSEAVATETTEPTTVEPTVVGADKPQAVYTVKEGDTYGCIAEKYYGSFEHWPDIMAVNPATTGYTEYGLHVGAQIVLPAVSANSLKPASTLCS